MKTRSSNTFPSLHIELETAEEVQDFMAVLQNYMTPFARHAEQRRWSHAATLEQWARDHYNQYAKKD